MKEPYSETAEKAVLGGIFCAAEAMGKVRPVLSPDDFHHSHHKEIYAAMADMHDKHAVIDIVTLSEYLRELGRLERVGNGSYLCELSDSCPSAANIEHYAGIVKKKAQLRKIIEEAREIAIQATAPGADPESIPTRLAIEMPQSIVVNQVSTAIKQLNRNIESGYTGLHPCYDLLARTIRKVSPGHLYVVGAYTSVGKSAWLVDFICRMYRHGMQNPGIAVFSTEMSSEQYLLRMLSNHTSIPTWTITENTCRAEQIESLIKAQVFFSTRNLYLYDRLYKVEDIERAVRMLKSRGLDIVAIDYLQNIWGEGKIYDRMSRLSPILQYLAKDLDVTIIALSQVSNEHVRSKGGSGGVFGYKGAGEIAASADLGIELERDPDDKAKVIFRVGKNRHGRVGQGVLKYVDGYTKFHEEVQPEGYGG